MYAEGYSLVSHRISGSFHWQLKLNKMGYGANSFAPTARVALMDTGSTRIIMPKEDWVSLYEMICANLPNSNCFNTGMFYVLRGCQANKARLEPIQVKIDNVVYKIPFERFFKEINDDTMMLELNTHNKPDHIVFGIQFLNSFYQVHDLRRNQLALVPNIYTSGLMAQPFVVARDKMAIVLPSSFASIIVLTWLAWHLRQEKLRLNS